ncbi:hypothetical protein QJQ45_021155 [Haematococcus lacustris]|nr:hypothetical protein QJQ45_021155 [Haematococcus lacustris]
MKKLSTAGTSNPGLGWSSRAFRSEAVHRIAGVVTITGCLLVYGVLQERIMTVGFGPHLELFDHSIFLVLCNRLVTCLLSLSIIAFTGLDTQPSAPLRSYAAVSLTNVVSTSCQYEALKFVSFAVQTLAKSAKALPVMLWASVYTGRRYKAWEYLHACAVTAGCTIFVMGGNAASRTLQARVRVVNPLTCCWSCAAQEPGTALTYLTGCLLMLIYLAVDGLTSTWQDSLFLTHHMSICEQVLYTTAFSSLFSFAWALSTGQLLPSLAFVLRHPDALTYILALSASSAVVQLIISYTIKQYGAVVFATIMTTRQFFSILLSSLVFWTPLAAGQWLGLAVVFGAMYARLLRPGTAAGSRASKPFPRPTSSPSLSPLTGKVAQAAGGQHQAPYPGLSMLPLPAGSLATHPSADPLMQPKGDAV